MKKFTHNSSDNNHIMLPLDFNLPPLKSAALLSNQLGPPLIPAINQPIYESFQKNNSNSEDSLNNSNNLMPLVELGEIFNTAC